MTNYATTRFLPGISIGAKAGYNLYPNLKNSRSYFVGATLSPFKSYRYYWQAEFVNSIHSYDGTNSVQESFRTSANGVRQLQRRTTSSQNDNINWEIPVLMRYNINSFIGIGMGLQANFNLSEKQEQNLKIETYEGITDKFLISTTNESKIAKQSFTNVKTGFVFDLTFGAARIGPSFGARYVVNFKENSNYFQLYGIWKF